MPIFILRDNILAKAQGVRIERESDIEDWLENSPWGLVQNEFILWIDRQPRGLDEEGTIIPDLFGVDSEGNFVIIEFKRERTPRDVMAQLLEYAAWVNGQSDEQIYDRAESYFEKHDKFKEKTFQYVFKTTFDIPETEEVTLNRSLRLFIIAGGISERILEVCRLLRTSYGVDVNCVEVSKFRTESGDEIVNMETKVGEEGFAISESQRHQTLFSSRWSGDKPARDVVWDAVKNFTQDKTKIEFTIIEILALIREDEPDFKRTTMDGIMIADTVNHPSRHHQPSAREDYYWRVERGKYRLYDSKRDKVQEEDE